jgi:hypothetical protein
MPHGGWSERRALRVIGMSASAYRYQPVLDRNHALREQIVALAQRHRRYGLGMIYLKLRQSGMIVIEAWRREYNEERPKKSLGGLTPAIYAHQLMANAAKLPPGSKAECY